MLARDYIDIATKIGKFFVGRGNGLYTSHGMATKIDYNPYVFTQ